MVDRVRPLKMEAPSTGGTQLDFAPREMDPNADTLDAAGLTLQTPTSNDVTVMIDRDPVANQMRLSDSSATSVLLPALCDLDGGPLQNSFLEIVGGDLFPTAEKWWSDASKTKLLKTIEYKQTGQGATLLTPNPIVTKFYAHDGVTVTATYTDNCTYDAVFLVSKNRVKT